MKKGEKKANCACINPKLINQINRFKLAEFFFSLSLSLYIYDNDKQKERI